MFFLTRVCFINLLLCRRWGRFWGSGMRLATGASCANTSASPRRYIWRPVVCWFLCRGARMFSGRSWDLSLYCPVFLLAERFVWCHEAYPSMRHTYLHLECVENPAQSYVATVSKHNITSSISSSPFINLPDVRGNAIVFFQDPPGFLSGMSGITLHFFLHFFCIFFGFAALTNFRLYIHLKNILSLKNRVQSTTAT